MCLIDKMYSLVLINDIKFHFEDFFSVKEIVYLLFLVLSQDSRSSPILSKTKKFLTFNKSLEIKGEKQKFRQKDL